MQYGRETLHACMYKLKDIHILTSPHIIFTEIMYICLIDRCWCSLLIAYAISSMSGSSLVSFKAHNCANHTFRMEKIVCMNQYCSMPPRLFKYLQLIHATWSSPWFHPSTHPLLSLVDTDLGQLLSCSSSLHNRGRGPPKTEQMPVLLMAFVMIVSWISTTSGELLNWLALLGALHF